MSTTYWLARKHFRDSVNYGKHCPSTDVLSLGDVIWSREESKQGPIWAVHARAVATDTGLGLETWDNTGDAPRLIGRDEVTV